MMDQKVVQYYRLITREGYKHYGTLESPSLFLDSVGEKIPLCSRATDSYVHVYITIVDDILEEVKYQCTCRPTANVVTEIFCSLIKGKTIKDAEALTEHAFSEALGTKDEEFMKGAHSIIELLHRGLNRFKSI